MFEAIFELADVSCNTIDGQEYSKSTVYRDEASSE